MPDQNNNLRIWNQLSKTDPAQTKQFTRSGGFKGTAIKPIWVDFRMTERFGPCGLGWGPEEPKFEVHAAGPEVLVFCTVAVWYKDGTETGRVFGVGGDRILTQNNNGARSSDEAFKSAYTDAIGNALKLMGVAADVHMGLFEDSKYVESVAAQYAGQEPSPGTPQETAAKVRIISKTKADLLRSNLNEAMKQSQLSQKDFQDRVKSVLSAEGFKGVAEITEDKLQTVRAGLEDAGCL